MHALRRLGALAFLSAFLLAPSLNLARAQAGTSGLVTGSVTDASGAVIPGATVNIHNALSGYDRTTPADAGGNFQFSNLPFGNYTLTVKQKGFQTRRAGHLRSVPRRHLEDHRSRRRHRHANRHRNLQPQRRAAERRQRPDRHRQLPY